MLFVVKKALQFTYFLLLYKAIQLNELLFFSSISDKFSGITARQLDAVEKTPVKADGPLQTV